MVEIKRSKRLKGQPVLQGDGLTGFQALLMGALAEGPTRLENLPDSPWFRDILQDFIRMGYAQQALDGHWTIHGGSAPVSGPEPLRVRHEAELLTLAGFLAAKDCRRSLAIDPACVSRRSHGTARPHPQAGKAPGAGQGFGHRPCRTRSRGGTARDRNARGPSAHRVRGSGNGSGNGSAIKRRPSRCGRIGRGRIRRGRIRGGQRPHRRGRNLCQRFIPGDGTAGSRRSRGHGPQAAKPGKAGTPGTTRSGKNRPSRRNSRKGQALIAHRPGSG